MPHFGAWMFARFRQGARRRAAARSKGISTNYERSLGFESLESRRLLAVTETFAGGLLTVNLNAASDTATITATAAASGGAQTIQLAGTSFTTNTFASTTAITINYLSTGQSATFNGSTAIAISGALAVNDTGNSTGEQLTFANTTTYSFGSVGIWTSQTASVGTVSVNDSLAASSGTLTIGTGTASTSAVWSQSSAAGTISASSGDVDISAETTFADTTAISDSTGTVRLVAGTGITDNQTITATNLSAVASTSGNIVMEGTNAISGTIAFSTTAATYSANNGMSFNDGSAAATIGATAANTTAGSFAAVTGITATDGDVNLKGAGLTINNPLSASAGSVRLIEAGSISQGASGTITANNLAVTITGTTGNAVLEDSNTAATLAVKSSSTGGGATFNDGTNTTTIGSVAAASISLDTNSLFAAAVSGVNTSNGDFNLKGGGLSINNAVSIGTGSVRLLETGAISQGVSGTITASNLSTNNTSTSAGGSVILEASNNVGTLAAAQSDGSLSVRNALTFSNGSNSLTIGTVAAPSATLDPGSLFAAVTGAAGNAGDIDIKSGGLAINQSLNSGILNPIRLVETGTVTGGSSGAITASAMSITTTTGNVIIEETGNTETGPFAVNDTASGGAVEFNSGAFGTTVGSVAAAAIAVDPNSLFGAVTGITTANGDVGLAGGGLTISNAISAGTGTVRIVESSSISQSATITASALSVSNTTSNSASIVLESTNSVATFAASSSGSGNPVTFVDGAATLTVGSVAAETSTLDPSGLFAAVTGISTSNGDVNLKGNAIAVNSAIGAGTDDVRMVAAGAVSQASTITTAALSTNDTSGNVVLESSNAIGTVASTSSFSGGTITLNNATTALTVGSIAAASATEDPSGLFGAASGISTSNADVNIKSAGLAVDNAISAGTGNVRLVESAAVSQLSAGTITAAGLSVTNSANSTVLEATNSVSTLAASNTSTGGAVTFNDGTTPLSVGTVAAASSTVDPSGLFSAVTGVSTSAVNGDVNIKSGGLTISSALAAGTGSVRLVESGAVSESAALTAGGLSVNSSSGNVVLEATTNNVGKLAGSDSVSAAAFTFNNGTNSLTLGSIAAAASAADPNSLFAAVTSLATTNGDINIESAALTLSAAVNAGTANVRLLSSGSISQTAGAITAADLSVRITSSAGNAILEDSNSISSTIAANNLTSNDAVSINNADALTVGIVAAASSTADPSSLFTAVTGIATTNGDVNLDSAGLSITSSISAGTGNVRLVQSGAVSQSTTGTIAAAGLSTKNSGGSTVLELGNSVSTRAANNTFAGGAVTFNNSTTALSIGTIAAASSTADPDALFGSVTGISTGNGDVNIQSGALTVNQAVGAGTGTVRLVVSGAISQATAGTITAADLSTKSTGTGGVVLESANNLGTLATTSTVSTGFLTFNNSTNGLTIGSVAGTGTGSAEDPNNLFSSGISGITTANGDVNLASGTLTINQAIAAGTANVRLVQSGSVSQASPGTITAGGLSVKNSGAADVLELSNSVSTLAASMSGASSPISFSDGSKALTLGSVATASSTEDPNTVFVVVNGATTSNGGVYINSGGLTISQAISIGTGSLRLAQAGNVTQGTTGTITGGTLGVSSTAGSVTLEDTNSLTGVAGTSTVSGGTFTVNNGSTALAVTNVAAVSSASDPSGFFGAITGITTVNGDVNLASAGLTVTNAIGAGTADVRFVESGAVSQAATGAITAAGLSTTNSGGSTVLEAANNVGIRVASSTFTGGAVTFNNSSNGLTVSSVGAANSTEDPSGQFAAVTGITTSTGNGDVNIESGTLTISNPINAGSGNVRLIASGAMGQGTTGTITTIGALYLSNSSGNAILESSNSVGTLVVSDTGTSDALSFNDNTATLTVGSIAAESSTLDPSGLFGSGAGITTAAGDANIQSTGLRVFEAINVGSSNVVRFVGTGAIGQATLPSVTTAAITASGLGISTSTGNVVLEASNTVGTLAVKNTASSAAVVFSNGANSLTIGSVAPASSTIDPSGLFGASKFAPLTGITASSGDVDVKSGALTISNAINAGTGGIVRLVAAGNITQSAAITTTGGLSISDSGGSAVLESSNSVGTLAASISSSTSPLTFSSGGNALTVGTVAGTGTGSTEDPSNLFSSDVTGISTTNGDVNLKSSTLAVSQAIGAGSGKVRLAAAGNITQSAAITDTGGLSISDSGGSVVLESTNSVATVAASITSSTSPLTFSNGTTASAVGTVAGTGTESSEDPSDLFSNAVSGIGTTNGDVNLKSGGLTISQAISAGSGNVRLISSGAVSQTAAITTSGGLSLSDSGGNVVLESANNVGTLAASNTSSGSAVTFYNGSNALIISSVAGTGTGSTEDPSNLFSTAVTGITTSNGDVNLDSSGLTINQAVGAGTAIVRFVDSGAITQNSSGAISSAELSMSVSTASNISLTAASNDVTTTLAINDPSGSSVTFNNSGNPSITATVAAAGSTEDPNGDFGAVTGITGNVPDLTINKSANSTFYGGDTGDTYSIKVTNSGTASTAGTVTVTDVVPTGETPTAFSGTGWTTTIMGQTVTATRSDPLSINNTYSTLTLTVNIASSVAPSVTNTATVAGGGEVNKSNDSSSAVTTIGPSDDLSVSKTGSGSVLDGSTLMYTLTVSNAVGASTAQGVTLSDILPSGETFVSQSQASGPAFTLSESGGAVSDTISSLAAGASAVIDLTVKVNTAATQVSNTATVSSTTHDSNPSNNSSTLQTSVSPSADLSITKTALESTVPAGGDFAYQLTVSNLGPSNAQSVSVSDLLPSNITFVSQSQSSGAAFTLSNAGNQVTDTISALNGSATAVITIVARVNSGVASGTVISNTATVSSGTPDSNSSNNTSSATITVSSASAVVVTDPFNPSTTDLVVTGPQSTSPSTVNIVSAGGGKESVTINGQTSGPFLATGRIVVYTGNGNTDVTLGGGISTPAYVFAGSGNDVLWNQGSDNSVLVGGGGVDSIEGGSGYNILIAGTGQSRLTGGPTGVASGGSIMIGGATTFQQNQAVLEQMLQAWSSAAAYATRMSELSTLGMNASSMIPNTVVDELFASTGQDWYWNISGHDLIAGAHGGTVST